MKPMLTILLALVLTACATAPTDTPSAAATTASPADRSVFTGRFIGSYFGDETGTLSLEIDDRGMLLWEGSDEDHRNFLLRGSVIYTDNRWTLKGVTDDGKSFQGFLQGDGTFSGTWEDRTNGHNGNFDLRKLRQ